MEPAAGEAPAGGLRIAFDRRLKLASHGSRAASDAGRLAFRNLGDAFGLSPVAGDFQADTRTGAKGSHFLTAQVRPSVCGRLQHAT